MGKTAVLGFQGEVTIRGRAPYSQASSRRERDGARELCPADSEEGAVGGGRRQVVMGRACSCSYWAIAPKYFFFFSLLFFWYLNS